MWESYGTYVYAVFSLCVCFFLGASSLLECVWYVSLLLYVGVWHSVPSAVLVAFPFFPANQVIFHCTSVYCVCRQSPCYCSTCHGMYHYYVCFVCSVTVFCGSSKLPFCASVHCVLLSLIHMLKRHFGVYFCCCYRPFISVAFTGMKSMVCVGVVV